MRNKWILALILLCSGCLPGMATRAASPAKLFTLTSPDGRLKVDVRDQEGVAYRLTDGDNVLLTWSGIGLKLADGTAVGEARCITSVCRRSLTEQIEAPFYRQQRFTTAYNELDVRLKGGFGVTFRAYNEGVAYRFYTTRRQETVIAGEQADFTFTGDQTVYLPYSTNDKKPEAMAFQNFYDVTPLSKAADKWAFLPVTVECGQRKVTLLESDLESYPGMFVTTHGAAAHQLKEVFAAYPAETDYYPWRKQQYVTKTTDFIARSNGARTYPWRVLAVTRDDRHMPVNNLVYALASPNRIGDTAWIETGKVAWDWWNDWNIYGAPANFRPVDFKAGCNTKTYE